MYTAAFVEAVQRVREKLSKAKEEWVELKQEASDLQEYSNAKITRVRKYLVVLQDKTRKLDASVRDADARLVPLKKEKRKLFNDLMSLKGEGQPPVITGVFVSLALVEHSTMKSCSANADRLFQRQSAVSHLSSLSS